MFNQEGKCEVCEGVTTTDGTDPRLRICHYCYRDTCGWCYDHYTHLCLECGKWRGPMTVGWRLKLMYFILLATIGMVALLFHWR